MLEGRNFSVGTDWPEIRLTELDFFCRAIRRFRNTGRTRERTVADRLPMLNRVVELIGRGRDVDRAVAVRADMGAHDFGPRLRYRPGFVRRAH